VTDWSLTDEISLS